MRFPREAIVSFTYERSSDTNQRIYFDIDETDTLLASGNIDGSIILYNLKQMSHVGTYPGHFDSVGCVAFNQDMIASGSGSR